jgi:L-fuculose-phosphate aldolase
MAPAKVATGYVVGMDLSPEVSSRIETAKDEIIAAGRFLGSRQYHVGLAGNISARVSENLLISTRHGADKEALDREELILCDLAGRKLAGKGDPTSELNMHRAAYRLRPEAGAVIHAHPLAATSFAAAGVPLDELQLPEMLVLLGPVGFVPYATPGSEALAGNLARLLPGHDAFLLENHGALSLGLTVRQAALRMDLLEQCARISLTVRQLGKPFALAPADRETLMGFRRAMARWGCEDFTRRER